MNFRGKVHYSLPVCVLLFLLIILSQLLFDSQAKSTGIPVRILNIAVIGTGLWFMRKLLLSFFSDAVTAVTMVMVIAGTSYFLAAISLDPAPTIYSFTLYILVIWLTKRWHIVPSPKHSILLAAFIGMALVINPSDFIVLLIPILWNVYDISSLKNKLLLFRMNVRQVLLILLIISLFITSLIIYFQPLSSFFRYPGYTQDGAVYMIGRNLWLFLCSFNGGWLLYSPIILLIPPGLYILASRNKSIFYAVFFFMVVCLFYLSSWSDFSYPGQPLSQVVIQSFAVAALPFGYLVQKVTESNLFWKISFYTVVIFLVAVSVFQSWQFSKGILLPADMTPEYYSAVFGRTQVPAKALDYLENKELNGHLHLSDSTLYSRKRLRLYDFEDAKTLANYPLDSSVSRSGRRSLRLDSAERFSPGASDVVSTISTKQKFGIRLNAWVYSRNPFTDNPVAAVITLIHEGTPYKYLAQDCRKFNLAVNTWNRVSLEYMTPDNFDPKDIMQAYIWYTGSHTIWVDDVDVEIFEPKF